MDKLLKNIPMNENLNQYFIYVKNLKLIFLIVLGNVWGHTEVCLMVARGWYHYLDGPCYLVAWPDR